MAFSKSEVNRAGTIVTEDLLPPVTPEEMERRLAAVAVLDWWRGEHARPLTRVAANLRYYAAEVGDPVVAQRLKRLRTIADKLIREPQMKLARMGDIGGVRAVVANQAAAYHVANRLTENWTISRFSDYVANPKADGYRALHLINRHRGRLIEVQIRTRLQDEWANMVEVFTQLAFPGLKVGYGPPELHELLADLSSANAELEGGAISLDVVEVKLQAIVAWTDTFLRERRDES